MALKRVYLLADHRKGAAVEMVHNIEPWIRKRAKLVGVGWTGSADLSRVRADLLLVLGGDGSILWAARRMGKNQIPTVGVNLGRLGFLAALSPVSIESNLNQLFNDDYTIESRLMLRCKLIRKRRALFETLALNDAVLSRDSQAKMITVEVSFGHKKVIDYRCDGIVIATPTGATGYSLSAGGPILDSQLEAFVITPICPHTLTNRPFVVPSSGSLDLRVSESLDKAIFTADGQETRVLGKQDWVELSTAKQRFQLVVLSGGDFYARLHTVLGWKGRI